MSWVVLDGELAVPCNLQSAIAGLNPYPRLLAFWDCLCQRVLKTGSCAAEGYEPRQVREEAAVNRSFWVPQVILVGAGWWR